MIRGSVSKLTGRDGTIRYRARIWVGGVRETVGIYDTEALALHMLEAAKARHADDAGALSLEVWAQRWLDLRATSGIHRSEANDRSRWHAHITGTRLSEMALRRITRGDVLRWLDELIRKPGRGARLSRQTVKHAFNLLRVCFADAVDRGHASANPCSDMRLPRVDERSDEPWTWLTAAEIAQLEAYPVREGIRRSAKARWLRPEERAIYRVAIYTGLRRGELWGLLWRDVRLDGGAPEITVRHSHHGPTKSGKIRRVPLLPQAIQALREWRSLRPGVGDAPVWPGVRGTVRREDDDAQWPKVAEWLGRPVRFHDLRHTCASHLLQGTWAPRPLRLEEVQVWLGHASITTTQRYSHLGPDTLHRAIRPKNAEGER